MTTNDGRGIGPIVNRRGVYLYLVGISFGSLLPFVAATPCDDYRECFCGTAEYCNRLLDHTIGPESCDDKLTQHILGYESGLNCVLDNFMEKRSRARTVCPIPTTRHRPQCDHILGPNLNVSRRADSFRA